jgi:hypothetical protein
MMTPTSDKFSPEIVADLTNTLDSVMDKTIAAIDSVNDQIRVLALNARIEAARAGDAGKAFNIVAMEIAGLSNSSTRVVANLKKRSRRTLSSISTASKHMSTTFRGTRLSDLARMNIDLIDRNLYERSCDVRWWATEASLIAALTEGKSAAYEVASRRMKVILESYTVYTDLVLCDTSGKVVANGRPDMFKTKGSDYSQATWFQSALQTRSGREFGFQSVHRSPLVNNQLSLVYSCAVRQGGDANGEVIGVLGIVFNWERFANTIVDEVCLSPEEKRRTRIVIVDPTGRVLADSEHRVLEDTIEFSERSRLFAGKKSFLITNVDGQEACIGHAASAGFETYATGWHSLLIQNNESEAMEQDAPPTSRTKTVSRQSATRRRRSKTLI